MSQVDPKYNPLLYETAPGSYAMFLPPDMASIKFFRRALRESLEKNQFSEDDIQSIELAADEALTNSIAANVDCESDETIICRWKLKDCKITLYIVDYGRGFKYTSDQFDERSDQDAKPGTINQFLASIQSHQKGKPDGLPHKGIKVGHKNIGKGLKIIHSLMDSVKIQFHSDGKLLEVGDDDKITGSIVQLEYNGKKRVSA